MTETFNEGDLIEATKGDTVIRGRLRDARDGDFWIGESTKFIASLEDTGFTVTLIEKAAPALPTEPGVYITNYGKVWELSGNRIWWFNGRTYSIVSVREYAPFTRLEPVPDTTKKVLDRFREVTHASFIGFEDALKQVRAEFGVTS